MKVQVMSRRQFEKYAVNKHNDTSIVISISSYNETIPYVECNSINKIVNILPLLFNDTDRTDKMYGAITREQALQIVNFVSMYYPGNVDKIIVHCGAGQSRSAGVAAAILKYYTNDDSLIFDNPIYTPNMLCYRLVLEAFIYYNS